MDNRQPALKYSQVNELSVPYALAASKRHPFIKMYWKNAVSRLPLTVITYSEPLDEMEFSLHLPNPFKTWAEFYQVVLDQRGPDSTEDFVTLTEVRPTGVREAGYVTHYSAPRVYRVSYIEGQAAREAQEQINQQTFTFSELQTILYALDHAAGDLDPTGTLRLKVQNMRNTLPKEPIP